MAKYSIAQVREHQPYGSIIVHNSFMVIEAKNYDIAIPKAIKKLKLKKGNILSIIRIGSKKPAKGFTVPSRYEVEV